MATYKLIQDIEAEDKILGPLTLRQFIFMIIACFFVWLCFVVVTGGAPYLLIVFLPPTIFFGFFAMPFGRDQPTEIWALAKIRYYFKPRQRIWNQSGVKEMVTITAPKKIEHIYTNGLSQSEVKSRLSALANTIDSRGWAVKNVNLNAFAAPSMMMPSSDRLINVDSIPQAVPDSDIVASDDMLDVRSNPIAQQFENMINQSSQSHRQQLERQMNGSQPTAPANDNYWFMNNASQSSPIQTAPVAADIDDNQEAELVRQLEERAASHPEPYSNMRTMKALSDVPTPASPTPPATMTAPTDPAILSLADNDDLNVSTLAREAKRSKGETDSSQGEVVISLH